MWRGPMLHRALEQFLSDVHWGELDTLVVDMPPGTGDVAISLGQLLPRAEVVVVTTPQPAAQQVAVRAAQMAQKTGMRLIGALENMSYLVGTGEELFGSGGGDELAAAIDAPLLGRIPLDPRCASRPTWASRSSGPSRRTRPRGRSTRSQRRSPQAAREPGHGQEAAPARYVETRRGARRRPSRTPVAGERSLAAAAVEQSGVVRRNGRVGAELAGQGVADHRRRPVAEQAGPRSPEPLPSRGRRDGCRCR